MDRRQFGKLIVGAGAATAGSAEATEKTLAQAQRMQRVTAASSSDLLNLPAELRPVLEQEYPRFSDAEYRRRHEALARVMEAGGIDHLRQDTRTDEELRAGAHGFVHVFARKNRSRTNQKIALVVLRELRDRL